LIFFLVTTNIDFEKGIGLRLPVPEACTTPIHPNNLRNILIIGQTQVAVDGEEISIMVITSKIKSQLADHPKLVVSIKSDSQSAYDTYLNVLGRVKQAWGSQPARISIADTDN
jgi:biopolymer transport protein ExbD